MSVRQPPTAVSARAREEGFGEPVDGIGERSEMLLMGVGGPLLFGGLAYVVAHFRPPVLGGIFAVLCGAMALFCAAVGWFGRNSSSWVFEGGIVDQVNNEVSILTFRDVTDVRESQEIGGVGREGAQYPTIRTVFLMQGDTVIRHYRGRVGTGSDAIGFATMTRFHRGATADIRDRVAAGEAVDLGAFTISKDGLHRSGDVLPWSRVTSFQAAQGSVFFTPQWGRSIAYPFRELRYGSAAVQVIGELVRGKGR
jgi:hypothetical protein